MRSPAAADFRSEHSLRRSRRALLAWYRQGRRDLPWRRTNDPYRIWLSEVMLQQTRVSAAIPYYERFLERFPDTASLAAATETELLAAWAGLGYYSRARNMHKAAALIAVRGSFPDSYEELRALPGVGEYTAAAVASIAFGRPHPALDGNVARVVSRFEADAGDIAASATRERLLKAARALMGGSSPGIFNQAMMELGATVCLPREPQCLVCPLRETCRAHREGRASELPYKRAKPAMEDVHRTLVAVRRGAEILFRQRERASKRLAGFWEMPEMEQLPGVSITRTAGEFRHTIVNTRFRIQVVEGIIPAVPETFFFKNPEDREIPFSTAARKALRCLDQQRGTEVQIAPPRKENV